MPVTGRACRPPTRLQLTLCAAAWCAPIIFVIGALAERLVSALGAPHPLPTVIGLGVAATLSTVLGWKVDTLIDRVIAHRR